jgi:hypothetical protein
VVHPANPIPDLAISPSFLADRVGDLRRKLVGQRTDTNREDSVR